MANHGEIVSFIWNVADLIRDSFKRGHYQDVILPFTVLRRIDGILEPTKQKVIDTFNKLKGKLENLEPQLCKASGFAFYNTSAFTFEKLLQEPAQLSMNLKKYINGFSNNMKKVIEMFDFENTIAKLETANLLFLVMERFADKSKIDLSPAALSNHEMGYVFEELIRKFNEALDENPGEHFTPREVIRLMATLLTEHDRQELQKGKVIRTVYDPCCGSGGMLTIARDRIKEINPDAEVHLFGQEVNPQTYAVSKSDLYIKSADGRDAENIAFGSVLAHDGHAARTFDYLLANPPYGKDWNLDADAVRAEAARATNNRFHAGLPRISDGQLLFLQHMLGRMHHPGQGTSRVSIIMNGSPLFTGDAGSGESEIRRWILESDYLEALIALPQQLFYNTGISTYVWVLTNNKPAARKGKVLLIDASEAWLPRRKSLGDKRRDIPDGVERKDANYIPFIVKLFQDFTDGTAALPAAEPKELRARQFPTIAFGYRKLTIERPLRLNFQAGPVRIARVEEARAFQNLAVSKKKDPTERAAEEKAGRQAQAAIREMLAALPEKPFRDRAEFLAVFDAAVKTAAVELKKPVRTAVLDALSERDETAAICFDKDGNPEPDPELRDTENVPLEEVEKARAALPTPADPVGKAVEDFFDREVKPHVPDAWVNALVRDEKDGGIGVVGYEINFNRYFYRYQPPRPLEAIEADIKAVEADVLKLLKEVAG
jgi:type I restriction enzyme M protein